ncbi:hypothetical protein QW131_17745 [Roseibium salinum]|nr:hypothetical protein [Roseibium salinum]
MPLFGTFTNRPALSIIHSQSGAHPGSTRACAVLQRKLWGGEHVVRRDEVEWIEPVKTHALLPEVHPAGSAVGDPCAGWS